MWKDWKKIAEENGINPGTYRSRINRDGLSPEQAATTPVKKKRPDNKWRRLANRNGIPNYVYYNRVDEMLWAPEKSATTPVMENGEVIKLASQIQKEHRGIESERIFNDKNNLYKLTPHHYKAAEQNGIKKGTVISRIHSLGWSVQEAITIPTKRFERPEGYLKYLEIAKINGISTQTYRNRVKKDWTLEDAAKKEPRDRNSRRRPDKKWLNIAIQNGINKNTYTNRVDKLSWTPEEAATIPALKRGQYLNKQTKENALNGLRKLGGIQ